MTRLARFLPLGLALACLPSTRADDYRHPLGWKVEVAAEEPMVVNPVTMTFGDDGRLFVVEWKAGRGPNDRIQVLTDTNGDGKFDQAKTFMDGLDLPAGVLFWDGWVYITLDHDVVRFRDKDGDGAYETRESIATGFGNDDSHHRVSGITIGPDGWLYLTTGDSDAHAKGSDGSTATVLRCGGVFRCKPDGSHMENVAFGMRNPWGNVAFDDAFRIFHTDNDNEGSPGFTGCRLLHVVDQGDYGWRLREGARCCNPDFERATWNGGRAGRLGWIAETGRGAPAGLCVLNSPAFPPGTRNLLVYPDVFRKKVRAYKLKPEGATYGVAEEFELLGSDEGLFRPTDAEVGPDGALYILDWRTDSGGAGQLSGNGKTGRIYRMTWSGTDAEPARPTLPRDRFAGLAQSTDARLAAALASPDDEPLRRAAGRELIRRGQKTPPFGLLTPILHSATSFPEAKRYALAVLFGTAGPSAEFRKVLRFGLIDRDASVRRYALELLARLGDAEDGSETDRALACLAVPAVSGDPDTVDPQVERAAALALGRNGSLRSKAREEFSRTRWMTLGEAASRAADRLASDPNEADGPAFEREKMDLLSADLVASQLLRQASQNSKGGAFLKDGTTRGLERLGPAGLKAVTAAIADPKSPERAAALYALEGWRSPDGIAAILDAAIARENVSTEARVGLFEALRELVVDVPPDPVANWLAKDTKAEPAAKVSALNLLRAMHARAALAVGPIVPALLRDANGDVRKAALRLAGDLHPSAAKPVLLELLGAERADDTDRTLALSALRGYDDVNLAATARGMFPKVKDAGLRLELLRAIAARDLKGASALAGGLLDETHRDLRQEAIGILGRTPETALMVARRYDEGRLPREDLSRVIDAVRPHATPELQAVLQGLLKKTVLAAPTGDEARRFRDFVGREGKADRGKAIYLDAKRGGCTVCHRLEGVGGAVGPDLTRVWETLSFDKRVESILEPSKEIKEGFGTFKVATKEGQVITGLLLSDTPDAVTLKDAQGREVKIEARSIEDKGPDKTSLMPAGVVGHLSLNELADLLAFLGDRKAQESLRKP